MSDRDQQRADSPIRILLIDDDEDDYALTKEVLQDIPHFHYELDWRWTFEDGLEGICSGNYDVCLVDYRLGRFTGLDLLKQARKRSCRAPIIFLTGQSGPEIDLAAMEAGAADFLEKSRLDATILDRAIRYARQQRNYETELENKVAERTEELARVNEALRLADKRKDEFLATLAHELRNPLAPIRNAIEIMRMAGKNPETMDRARNILDRQTLQLIRLIDDLLDISRITRDKLTLNFDILSIQAVLELAVETTQPLIDRAGLTLKIQIPDEPIKVRGDQLRLAQIFSNILNNAAKYTARGGTVCVAVAREGAQVIVRIRDSGMGIPAEMLPKIFELFAQVDRTLDRSRGGLGIGLSLVRRLTEMHGGTVEAHSEGNDRGTELIVRLPIVNASHPLTDNSVI